MYIIKLCAVLNKFVEFLKYEVLKNLENKFFGLDSSASTQGKIFFGTQIDSRLEIWVAIQFKTDLSRR